MMSIARYRAIDLLRHEKRGPTLVPDVPERAEVEPDPPWNRPCRFPGRLCWNVVSDCSLPRRNNAWNLRL